MTDLNLIGGKYVKSIHLIIQSSLFMQSYLKSPLELGCRSVEIRMPVGGRPGCKENRDADAGRLLYTHEEMLDETFGVKGTPKRDKFEKDIEVCFIGEAIKQTRLKQQLTQKQLGELVGVQEAQISKIENGKSVTYSTIVKVFKAMGAKAETLDLGSLGKVALW